MKRQCILAAAVIGVALRAGWAAETTADPKTPAEMKVRVAEVAKKMPTLTPDQAAEQWWQLVDQSIYPMHHPFDGRRYEPFSFGDLGPALPAKERWPALEAYTAKRAAADPTDAHKQLALCFSAALLGDNKTAQTALDGVQAAIQKRAPGLRDFSAIDQLRATVNDTVDSKAQLATFESQLNDSMPFLGSVPDLVTIAGPEKAEQLLRRALMKNGEIRIEVGDETRALAKKLALSMADKLPSPQWGLCDDIHSIALYEAMQKRSDALKAGPPQRKGGLMTLLGLEPPPYQPQYDESVYGRDQARPWYMASLIAAGRTEDAVKVAQSNKETYVDPQITDALIDAGYSENLYTFAKQLVQIDPKSAYWSTFTELANSLGKTDEVLALVKKEYARTDLAPEVHWEASTRMVDAWLAADDVDDAVKLLRSQLASALDKDKFELALRLARIGRVTQRAGLTKEGLDQCVAAFKGSDNRSIDESGWAREMRLANRADELVQAVNAHLEHAEAAVPKDQPGVRTPALADLSVLAQSYYLLGRPEPLVELVRKSRKWPVGDLAELPIGQVEHSEEAPMAFYVAWALAKTQTMDYAKGILNDVLHECGGLDPAYALLLQFDPQAMAKLDDLAKRDRFEERPLIWKAVLLRQAGKLDEAEQVCRQAIAIDPSDGEEPKGDRMRVYAVLADVLSDKKDAKEAAFYRQVVASIRESEDADDAWMCGLTSRAVAMYTDALNHFSDAYCIQSRLAVRLADLGKEKEAEEHYRKAFELMPGSFGRVESHCFGCERTFAGATPQNIAERVFTQMLAKDPNKPQLHYLLGYLRMEQGRYPAAADEFRAATRLDPDYLNAWKKLIDVGNHLQLSTAEKDAAILNQLRLDPQGLHSNVNDELSEVHDVGTLWTATTAADAARWHKPASLLPFPASAEEIARNKRPTDDDPSFMIDDFSKPKSPGTYVLESPRIKPIFDYWTEVPGYW
ncbi:MAG: tetratricopeptide repeat protein [Tepidisphaeraceae bacterium]